LNILNKEYIPFGRPSFTSHEIDAVSRILMSGWIGMGQETILFESELASYINTPHLITVNSCTSALFLSLLVSGVGEGDEVVCPSLTWCSTANAALYLRALPKFSDINAKTLCSSIDDILKVITPKTKAVIVVHYGGYAIDVSALRKELPKNISIIEDAAHALGSKYPDGNLVGSSGNLVCFSFYANKNLTTGEGGAIAISDLSIAEKLKSLRQHNLPIDAWKRFTHKNSILLSNSLNSLGYKMNFTDLQASIGRVQLTRFTQMQEARQKIADIYFDQLKDVGLIFQENCQNSHHAKHLFTVRLPDFYSREDRDKFVLRLRSMNIGASIHYAPLHLMPLYLTDSKHQFLPITEKISNLILTLPISASLTESEAYYIANSVNLIMNELN